MSFEDVDFRDVEEALVTWMNVVEIGRKSGTEEQREWLKDNTPLAIFDDDSEVIILAGMFGEMIEESGRFSAGLRAAKVVLDKAVKDPNISPYASLKEAIGEFSKVLEGGDEG